MPLAKYCAANNKQWDKFVAVAKNANFQHYRAYIEYHKNRFEDHSILYIDNGNVSALLPANIVDNELHSHQGLTFGGLLFGANAKQKQVLYFFDQLMAYANAMKLTKISIKLQPHIYDKFPSEEIHYALFRNGAILSARQVSSVIDLRHRFHYGKGRKWSLGKARASGVEILESDDYESFMAIEETLLSEKYNTRPVHTTAEIKYLKSVFPDNIRLFAIQKDGEMLGGALLYISGRAVKCQYIGSTQRCREVHGLGLLFDKLLHTHFRDYNYFDFGHSTLHDGGYLEDTLIQNKESYGARAVCYDTYTITL